MFAVVSRAPRRTAFGFVACGLLSLVLLLLVKDLNEKLSVMTASNSAYQRMTDQQADKIKKLQVK